MSPGGPLRLGTRGSTLARRQSELVADALRRSGREVELITVVTQGDVHPPDTAWGEGAFVGALESALLAGTVDLAVHSAKDVPIDAGARRGGPSAGRHGPTAAGTDDGMQAPARVDHGATAASEGLVIAAYLPREDPRDALVAREGIMAGGAVSVDGLPAGARVGTDSPRRGAFLRAWRPDLRIVPLHGNVDTRLRHLDAGDVDALVLAVAGLVRLGHADRAGCPLDPGRVPPAPAQGALAVQCRSNDVALREALATLDDATTRRCVEAEREVLRATGGGCRAPLGALATPDGERVDLLAGAIVADGRPVILRRAAGKADALDLARELGRSLLEAGFRGVLA